MSALARYYFESGNEISGSDLEPSVITAVFKKLGIKIDFNSQKKSELEYRDWEQIQQSKLFIQKPNLVIYSPAVEKNNPELKAARESGIECKSYPEALGELTKKYFTIAVSGAHGKSTTTSMLALVMIKAGLDPTVIVGTKLKEFGDSNFRMGKSKYLLIEADEWNASFLNYWPKIIALTNIDKEHLDYYKDLNHILKTYKEYILHLPKNGVLIYNNDDKNIRKLNPKSQIRWTRSGLPEGLLPKKILNSNIQINNYSIKQKEAGELKKILKVPGTHNIYNALAVVETARVLGISDEITFSALSQYHGVWRRFEESELEIENCKLKIVSDYAHHPAEVQATLQAAREKYPDKKIWCVFQPHQYQRTYLLFNDFVKIFRQAQDERLIDKMIITDIYSVAGRESDEIKKKVNSEKLVKKVGKGNIVYVKKAGLKKYILENIKDIEVLIIMGAGTIYKLAGNLVDNK